MKYVGNYYHVSLSLRQIFKEIDADMVGAVIVFKIEFTFPLYLTPGWADDPGATCCYGGIFVCEEFSRVSIVKF